MTQTISSAILLEHYSNMLQRIDAIRSAMDDEVDIYYLSELRKHGLQVGDRVRYHNTTYYISPCCTITTTHDGDLSFHTIGFAVKRTPDSSVYRWLPIEYLCEFTKVED